MKIRWRWFREDIRETGRRAAELWFEQGQPPLTPRTQDRLIKQAQAEQRAAFVQRR